MSRGKGKIAIALGILAVAVIIILWILIRNFFMGDQVFNGNRIKNPDRYYTYFEYMNQQDTHTLKLCKEDVLKLQWEVEKGSIKLIIGQEGKDPIYEGSLNSASFDLIIPSDGVYTIWFEAQKAKGYLEIIKNKLK